MKMCLHETKAGHLSLSLFQDGMWEDVDPDNMSYEVGVITTSHGILALFGSLCMVGFM